MTSAILLVLWLAALGATIFALVHAVRQRPDAFTAVDKLTKPIWVGILVAALAFLLLARTPVGLLGIIAVVATGVYLADVRPKVDEVQRGPRW
ncbi:protein-S-isoprenylcysteine O-methyltransferase Ste14 [Nocardia transvalensis]|uniref:Protein-S-isoprenylcysteine O-methyltransferase Ste14 n=1 Tax=Nocardia transvalensis TaxID=37333 RepID=A0A7W9PDZ3_9NOCA|nr:protein-S-isoprenylcysteine O-methyltransferase Ste14 [Nocardia transvalensis]